jgi:hypothetical protein
MDGIAPWARVVLEWPDGVAVTMLLEGDARPDLGTVEGLARLGLVARRGGCRMHLREVSPALAELLELAGLSRELGASPESAGEVVREAKRGEDPLGVQEGVDAADETT